MPGAAVAVSLDGRIVFVRGYGLADREANIAVQPNTRFRLADGTKPNTAALTLKLVEDGRLSLDDRAFVVLNYPTPTYAGAQRDPRLDRITVRQLLNHSGGWNRSTAVPPFPIQAGGWEPTYYQTQVGALMRQSPATPETTARFMAGQPLQFDPGTGSSPVITRCASPRREEEPGSCSLKFTTFRTDPTGRLGVGRRAG